MGRSSLFEVNSFCHLFIHRTFGRIASHLVAKERKMLRILILTFTFTLGFIGEAQEHPEIPPMTAEQEDTEEGTEVLPQFEEGSGALEENLNEVLNLPESAGGPYFLRYFKEFYCVPREPLLRVSEVEEEQCWWVNWWWIETHHRTAL